MKVCVLVFVCLSGHTLGARLPYIVGGQNAEYPGKWPWQASQQIGSEHSCGASILSARWLLTAAHCLGGPTSLYTVVVGMHDRLAMSQGNPVRHRIRRLLLHPGWTNDPYRGFPNDIALIEVEHPMDLSGPYAKPIKMAASGQTFVAATCFITGWGLTSSYGDRANILQEAPAQVYTNSYCAQYFKSQIFEFHICIGNPGVSAACSSDSGGPLACKTGNTWTLAGVTSWGDASCSPHSPDVYARVSYYRNWIKEQTGL